MQTQITFVLDSSGSMSAIEDDTVGGFNAFLSDQRDEPGKATVALYSFDSTVERVYHGRPVEEAPELDAEQYTPGGRTALHDAIVTAIDETVAWIDDASDDHPDDGSDDHPDDTPDNVIVVVLTDGKENASETPSAVVRERVTERADDGWEFLFIGANQDAALTAEHMGMDADRSLDMAHDDEGARDAYRSTSRRVSEARRSGSTGGYDESDRRRQRRDGSQ